MTNFTKIKRFTGNESKYLNELLKFGFKFRRGSFITALQNKWSQTFKKKYSITTNSCTSSLHSIFLALNLSKKDEVLVPSLVPFMCSTMIHLAGGTPVYVDIDKKNFLMDFEDLKKKLQKILKLYLLFIQTQVFVIYLSFKKFVKKINFT